jgi:hypothetical protein
VARTIVLYRGIQGSEAVEQDFWSNKRKGKKPRGPELTNPREHDAVSCWDTREKVEAFARVFPQVGSHVAELHVPDDGPLELVEEGDPGHWNLYGDPAAFLPFVTAIHPVRPE